MMHPPLGPPSLSSASPSSRRLPCRLPAECRRAGARRSQGGKLPRGFSFIFGPIGYGVGQRGNARRFRTGSLFSPRIHEEQTMATVPQPAPVQADIDWFVHDRFGMFIHWGTYALAARHEWVKNREAIPDDQYQKYFE